MTAIPSTTRHARTARVPAALAVAALLAACGGGGSDGPDAATAPTITVAPLAASGIVGGSATFSVTATGTGLVYQWQLSTDAGINWADIAGATAAQYVVAAVRLAQNGWLYRVRISGGGSVLTSTPVALTAQCTLAARLGGRAYYDPCLNVTWVADANLAVSLPLGVAGIQADGGMAWSTAKLWVQALNASGYLGYADWRLPAVRPLDGSSFQLNGTELQVRSGQVDLGFNISAPGSRYAASTETELPFLFYNDLGAQARYALDGTQRASWGSNGTPLANVTRQLAYWTGQSYGSDGAYAFNFDEGSQFAYVAESWRFAVLPLRDGDVGTP